MFDLHAAPRFKTEHLVDNPSKLALNFYFLDDPRNNFQLADWWSINQVQADRLLVDPLLLGDTGIHNNDCIQLNKKSLRAYLAFHQRFLSLLAVLFYLTAGLPPRREELVGLTWRNRDIARNVYISDGLVTIITGYDKSQRRVGNRPVARFLPHAVRDLFIRYLIYVTPFVQWVKFSLGEPGLQGYLFSRGGATP